MLLVQFIILCLQSAISYQQLTKIKDDFNTKLSDNLMNFTKAIIDRYFYSDQCIVVVSNLPLSIKIDTSVEFFEIREDLNLEECSKDIGSLLLPGYKYNCSSYVVMTSSPLCFWKGYFWARNNSLVRQYPRFIFLPPSEISSNKSQEVTLSLNISSDDVITTTSIDNDISLGYGDLFKINQTEISPDIIAVFIDNATYQDGEFKMKLSIYTNNFYVHMKDSDNREPSILLDEWDNKRGFYIGNNLFYKKLDDLQGKVIRWTSWSYPPFSVAESNGIIDGIEGKFARLFCKLHNCTLKRITDDFMWGTVNENMTGNGVIGQVFTEEADMGGCGVYLWPRELWFVDWSTTYTTSVITCLVPKPHLLSGWMVPFLPFDWKMWLVVFGSLLAAAASLRVVTQIAFKYTRFGVELKEKDQFFSIGDSLIRSLGLVVLQAPSNRMIGDSPNRYLFTSFEILFLFITSCYGAGLASYLTVPMYSTPVDSLADLLASGMNWLVEHEAFLYSFKGVQDQDIVTLSSKALVRQPEELIQLGLSGKYAVGLEVLASGYAPEQPYITEELVDRSHIMRQHLYGAPLGIVIQKGSPYINELNMLIYRILDAGIMEYWEGDIARHFLNSKIQSGLRRGKTLQHDSEILESLKLKHIQGTLFILIVGLILASIAFIFEIITYKKQQKKKLEHLAIIIN